MQQPANPGPVDRKVLRPRRFWYVLAAGIALLGLVAGGLLGWQAYTSFPTVEEEVASGETATVHLEDGGMTVFVDRQFLEGGCEAEDTQGREVPLDPVLGTETVTVNDQTWQAVLRTSGPFPAEEYTVECNSDSGAVFGIGSRASVWATVGAMLGAIGSAGLGVLVAAVVTLVVFFRRRGHRKRFEAHGANGAGYPAGGGPYEGPGQHGWYGEPPPGQPGQQWGPPSS